MKSNRKILALFLILTTILSSITVFYISAAQAVDEITIETENVVIEHELVPVMANACIIYQHSSIPLRGNVPNATYYWTSTGTAGGIVYSIAKMDSYGRTIFREDLISYNGVPLHHDTINGPHSHTYEWEIFVKPDGTIHHNITKEDIVALY